MYMIKINMNGESMEHENEINELMDLHSSYGSFKEVNGELIENENIDDLLDAYEYETDIFYFEIMNVENLGLKYLKIDEIKKV